MSSNWIQIQRSSGLLSITIPESVTSVGVSAFEGCSGLTSITIPATVTSIGGGAFSGSDNIMEVKSKILKPFNADVFSESTYRNGTLYIPQGTMSLYTRFDGWRNFLNNQEEAADGEPKFLTLNIAGNGVLLQQIELGKSYSFRIVPDEGWRINAVVYNGEDVTAQLSSDNMYETSAINDNATLVVSFESVVPDAVRAEERKSAVRVYASEGSIVVRDGCIGSELTVYDMQGRCMIINIIAIFVAVFISKTSYIFN